MKRYLSAGAIPLCLLIAGVVSAALPMPSQAQAACLCFTQANIVRHTCFKLLKAKPHTVTLSIRRHKQIVSLRCDARVKRQYDGLERDFVYRIEFAATLGWSGKKGFHQRGFGQTNRCFIDTKSFIVDLSQDWILDRLASKRLIHKFGYDISDKQVRACYAELNAICRTHRCKTRRR
jgi:hypothetical protein